VARAEPGSGLRGSPGPLVDDHGTVLLDLDGVVFLGGEVIPAAPDALDAVRASSTRIGFVTNNASRTPEQLAAHLGRLGVRAQPDEVVTAAMAAAEHVAARLPAGAAVLAIGGDGVAGALAAAGLRPVTRATDDVVAVVQGYGPDVGWCDLAEAAVAVRAGAWWVATNTDRTLPSPRGPLPGNGALVAAVATATGAEPESVGKPGPVLFRTALAHLCDPAGSGEPEQEATEGGALMVGDRLETDIEGGRRAGLPTLFVLSGASSAEDLLRAPRAQRPDYIGTDVSALLAHHPDSRDADGTIEVGAAAARCQADEVVVSATDVAATPDGLDGLRALCGLTWSGGCDADAAVQAWHSSTSMPGRD
jgi:HAD superfamily hydrolase (TIGR01450 family)